MIITFFTLLLMFLKKRIMWECLWSVNVMPGKEDGPLVLVCTGNSPDLRTLVKHCDRTEKFSRMTLLYGVR